MASDAIGSNTLTLTHDYLSTILGIRRPRVTGAAGELKNKGAIDYYRGVIQIVGREALEDVASECYETVKKEFDRMFEGG